MNSIASKSRKSKTNTSTSAGDIQAQINLQDLAQLLIGPGEYGGLCLSYFLPQFDPDYPTIHIFKDYYRNPATPDRGGAIKFVMKVKGFGYSQALAFLDGYLLAQGVQSC